MEVSLCISSMRRVIYLLMFLKYCVTHTLPVCMRVCGCPKTTEEGTDPLALQLQVVGSFLLGCWGQKSGPLKEQHTLFSTEPSLQRGLVYRSVSSRGFSSLSGSHFPASCVWISDVQWWVFLNNCNHLYPVFCLAVTITLVLLDFAFILVTHPFAPPF